MPSPGAASTSRSSRAVRSPSTCRRCAATSPRRSPTRRARRRRRRSADWRGTGISSRHPTSRSRSSPPTSSARSSPTATGDWEIGVRAVGPVTVLLDGAPVVSIEEGLTGGRLLRHGQPGGPRDDRARGGAGLRAARRLPGRRARRAGARPRRRRPPGPGRRSHRARRRRWPTGADVAIVIVGTDDDWETEGEDRTGLALPLDQDELVAAVVAANPNTVVVLNTGSPVTMPWLDDAPAVLQLWFPGQEIGDALVDVLTGDVEPGGRLPITYPAPPRGHAGVRLTPRARRSRRVRRGAVHRPPLVRPRGHRAAVPVRVRARLHDVRAAHGGGERRGRARRHRRRHAAQHRRARRR